MNKMALVACLGLGLSACACGPTGDRTAKPSVSSEAPASTTRHVSAKDIHFARGTAEQAQRLPWIRPGTWKPVMMEVVGATPMAAAMSVDKLGGRIVALHGDAGYDVYKIDLDCAKANYAVVEARRADRDDHVPEARIKATQARVAPPEVKRFCADHGDRGIKGMTTDAVAVLRRAGPVQMRKPPEISAEARARLWEAYKAKNGVR